MNVIQIIDKGGPVLLVLIALSVVAMAIAVLKLFQFWRSGLKEQGIADSCIAHLDKEDVDGAFEYLQTKRSPVARVLESAVKHSCQGTGCGEKLEAEVRRVGSLEIQNLESLLRGLASIGQLSPLLGLLGTVMGMITAFQKLEGVGSRVDPSLLAGGIWEALLTTAVGLAIAIPTMAVYFYLEGEVDKIDVRMKDAVTRVFTHYHCKQEQSELVELKRANS